MMFLQFFTLLIVKMFTGHEFYNRSNIFQKMNHIFENLNYASPYIDWDVAPSSRKGFKNRYRYFLKFVGICKHMLFIQLGEMGDVLVISDKFFLQCIIDLAADLQW